jgi:hypothetical protein
VSVVWFSQTTIVRSSTFYANFVKSPIARRSGINGFENGLLRKADKRIRIKLAEFGGCVGVLDVVRDGIPRHEADE